MVHCRKNANVSLCRKRASMQLVSKGSLWRDSLSRSEEFKGAPTMHTGNKALLRDH